MQTSTPFTPAHAALAHDPEDVVPQLTMLSLTTDNIGPGSTFNAELGKLFASHGGELVSFEPSGPHVYRDSMLTSVAYELVCGIEVELFEDDTRQDVRRKLAERLRGMADLIEGGA